MAKNPFVVWSTKKNLYFEFVKIISIKKDIRGTWRCNLDYGGDEKGFCGIASLTRDARTF